MKKHTIISDGKALYVETYGLSNYPPVLYIHGGPGSGAYDFSYYQAKSLSKKLYVIVLDQRGVLRSEALQEEESITVNDIIDDFEAVRAFFSVEKWSIIGHSFGGFLALRYAQAYAKWIEKIIFVCPSIDILDATESLLSHMIDLTCDINKKHKIRTILEKNIPASDKFTYIGEAIHILGDESEHLYVHGKDKHFFERLMRTSLLPVEDWQKGAKFQMKLLQDQTLFTSELLNEPNYNHKVLLVHGKYDPVASDRQCKKIEDMFNAESIFFEKSGHFPFVEEPDAFAQTVQTFIKN